MKQMPEDIAELDQRIQAAKQKNKGETKKSKFRFLVGTAFQVATEFVAPVIVGFCLGYTIDLALRTKPVLTIILTMFGGAAGILNMYKIGKNIEKNSNE